MKPTHIPTRESAAAAATLRAERAAAKLSQVEMAERLGISERTYIRLEGDERALNLQHMVDASEAFGLDLVEFMRRVKSRL